MGVRYIVSTWAFLAANPETLISYDIKHPSEFGGNMEEVYESIENLDINFKFIKGDTTEIEIEETDLLFIDTLHIYKQLKKELELHANKVKKYIIFHDTATFADRGELNGEKGIRKAIDEFLSEKEEWVIEKEYKNNNGLLIIKKKLI